LTALVVNRLQKAGFTVGQLQSDYNSNPAGTFIVKGKGRLKNEVAKLSKELGIDFEGVGNASNIKYKELNKIKVGLYKSWQANMDEGWTRWMLEQFEFDIDTLHNKDIKNGNLSKYSAIIFPSQRPNGILHGYRKNSMPEKFTGGIELDGMEKINQYAKSGGTVVFFDAASDLAIEQLGLPVRDVISNLSSSSFFIPGSLVRMEVDTKNPLGFGMMPEVAASFNQSRAFQTIQQRKYGEGGLEDIADAPKPNVTEIAKYASENILMSGWAMGEDRYLKNKSAMLNIPHDKGNIVLFGFRPQFRGQPRGTYKLIFNSIYMGAEK
jgi:hypothetical protein